MKKRIVVVGSVNLDLVVEADRLPAPGETLHGNNFAIFNGGKGANQAVGIARLGWDVEMIACLGTDLFSQRLLSGLKEAGVGTEAVEEVPGSSGVALISIAEDGNNSIIVVPGANDALSPRYIDAHLDLVRQARIVLMQLEIPLQAVLYLADRAWEAGVPLMLDPAPAVPLPNGLLRRVAWLTPNETEVQTLLGCNRIAPEAAAERLLDMGVRNIALKLGARGILIAGQDCPMQMIPAFPVKALDTTAAGDSFNAAFAVGLARSDSPAAAAKYAAAAAAISVMRAGAQPSLPSLLEVELFLSTQVPLVDGRTADTSSKRRVEI